MAPGNGEFRDDQVQLTVVIPGHKSSVARPSTFSREPGNLDLHMKPSNFNMLAHFIKIQYSPNLNMS